MSETNHLSALLLEALNDVMSAYDKATLDAMIFGTGIVKVDSEGMIHYLPPEEWANVPVDGLNGPRHSSD